MDIFELAKALGEALKNDKRMVEFAAAKEVYEQNEQLGKLSSEYQVQQMALGQELSKTERDTLLIDTLQARIDDLYKAISEHPTYLELLRTQKEVNDLMNQVNRTIEAEITGEEPKCTHDCSTCGGCH